MKPNQVVLLVIAALGLALLPTHLPGCGPFLPEAYFTFASHPQFPPDRYMRGDLGVVPPSYVRRYLVVAWRYLSEKPLTAREQRDAMPPGSVPTPAAAAPPGTPYYPPGVGEWVASRARVNLPPPQPPIDPYRLATGSQWQQFANCTEDAFRTAARTLDERAKAVADRAHLLRWAGAQDAVFSNCAKEGRMPEAPEPGLPAILIADRAYQTAAAHFYRAEFETASKEFLAIAADASSPWSRIAPYLAARCHIRQGTLAKELDKKLLAEAEQELKAVLADPDRRELHAAAEGLLAYVWLRLHPGERLKELAAAVADPANEEHFRQDLIDYEYLMDREMNTPAPDLDALKAGPELTYWIVVYQTPTDGAREAALAMWRTTHSLPWLLASTSKLHPGDAAAPEIGAEAAKVQADSPAYPTLVFDRVRLLLDASDRDGARRLLDAELQRFRKTLAPESLNLFLAWRMKLARDLRDFLEFAPRRPAAIDNAEPGLETGELFDVDAARVLDEQLPLSALTRASLDPVLPVHLRNEVLAATWVRAVLLEDRAVADRLAAGLGKAHPELAPWLKEYAAAADPAARRFAGASLLLKSPGLKPYLAPNVEWRVNGRFQRVQRADAMDLFHDNWWCAIASPQVRYLAREVNAQKAEVAQPANFLSAGEKSRFRDERERLEKVGSAPDYLGRVVTEWARSHPDDPRVPESLHLAVKASRFGCSDSETGKVSKAAFDLLHRKYPDSPWAKATPYWYK